MNYENWTKEDLMYECRKLERENERLQEENRQYDLEIDSLKFKIRNELEPRIKAERRAYDGWITDSER